MYVVKTQIYTTSTLMLLHMQFQTEFYDDLGKKQLKKRSINILKMSSLLQSL